MLEISGYVLFDAFVLDFLVGDPRWLPHPVVGMGNGISFFEPRFRRWFKNLFFSGCLFAVFLILSTWALSFALVKLTMWIHPLLGTGVQILLLFYCFSAKSLVQAARDVARPLEARDIETAQKGWAVVREMLQDPSLNLIVLDELTYPLKFGWLDLATVLDDLENRPFMQHVVITGRAAPDGLCEVADTVTEMKDVKHAFRAGIIAQKGIDL